MATVGIMRYISGSIYTGSEGDMATLKQFYTPAELSERWSLDDSTVRRFIARGEIRAVKFGARAWRVSAAEVERIEREWANTPAEGVDPAGGVEF